MLHTCEVCGTEYSHWRKKSRFCGRACYQAHHAAVSREAECPHCGKTFSLKGAQKRKFCSTTCRYAANVKLGHRYVAGNGYEYIRVGPKKYVLYHRLIATEMLGRDLLPTEIVHHKNGCKTDNRPENLEVFEKESEHLSHHWNLLKEKNGGVHPSVAPEVVKRRAATRRANTKSKKKEAS